METGTASSAAISEVLNVNNYLVWSVQVRTYLIAQDLWDIVEAIDECPKQEDDEAAFKAWSKKNAMALHVIQISCPQRICHVISLITSAKIAWETLEEICRIPKSDYVGKEEENYVAWSNWMKTILMKHDLWNIVETTTEPTSPAWSKKNALALYLIRESCGQDRFSLIEKISMAKIAWDTIIEMNKSNIDSDSDLSMKYPGGVDEYKDWCLQVKTKLKCERLWDIVEGTDEPPKAENVDAAFMAWSHKNAKALEVIKDSCIGHLTWAIEKISSAKIAWDTLAAIYALLQNGFEFPEYDGKNYLDWSLQVKAILTDRQLWDIVEGTDDPPKAEKNDMALGLIRYSCYWCSLDDKVRYITSAKIAWNTLAAICALPKNILTDKKSIAAVIERLESIPAVIKRLDDIDNYKDWSDQVKTYLTDQQLWDIVEGTNEPPKAENDEVAFKAWSKKNAMALGVIVFSCGYRFRFVIWWITSAKIVWDTLAEICEFPKSSYIDREEFDYVAWSVRMEAYLKAYDLWDIVEAATEPPNAWSKKNAKALYLIWESSEAFFSFKKSTRTAQIAWDTLAGYHNSRGIENNEHRKYGLFRQYLRDGNWDDANKFITSNPGAESATISNTGSTALHIVIFVGHLQIVKELVNMLPIDKLRMRHKDGNTILGFCALVGSTEMAKCIVGKCPILLSIENELQRLIPVVISLTQNSNTIAMAQYLYSVTPLGNLRPTEGVNGATFVTRCIYSRAFDMALDVLEKFPTLVTALDIEKETPVLALASISSAYMGGNHLIFWKRWIYNCIHITRVNDIDQIPVSVQKPEHGKSIQVRNIALGIRQIYELKLLHHQCEKLLLRMGEKLQDLHGQQLSEGLVDEAIIKAAKKGMVEFVTAIWSACPELVWAEEQDTRRNPFMCAVLYRQHEVFRRLDGLFLRDLILATTDNDGNNILHMAAMIEPSARRSTVPGAAFHMQREVQWFKEVESIVNPSILERTNTNGKRPRELFTESHKELVKEGEIWMKGTASSCTVVAALIVTIMFAAIITVPGGNKQDSGLPTFLNEKVFMVFIISDALSLLSASTSLLMFLGILTARYVEEDFLRSLPIKMMIGLSTLILSITTMMITFCASLFIILKGKSWVVIPIICLASVPVILFAWMQFHLLIDMVISTYGSSFTTYVDMVISTYGSRILDKKAKYGS